MSSEDEDIEARLFANLRALQQRNAARPDPPPLRIHHLMACTVVAAVLLSLFRFFWSLSPQQQTFASSGVFAFTQVLTSIGLTLTGFSIYWWRKGYASFSEPGQMLLVQYAATLVQILMSFAFALAMSSSGRALQSSSWMSMLPMMMGIGSLLFGVLLPIAFYGWCVWKVADTWPWRVLFVLCALGAILTSTLTFMLMQFAVNVGSGNIQTVVGVPHLIRGTMLLSVGMLAVVTDLAAKRKRSWTHWAGIILWLLGQIGSFLMGLYYMFFWQIA
jgi:hypothetical protein